MSVVAALLVIEDLQCWLSAIHDAGPARSPAIPLRCCTSRMIRPGPWSETQSRPTVIAIFLSRDPMPRIGDLHRQIKSV